MEQSDFQAELKRRRQQQSQQPSSGFQEELKRRRSAGSAQQTPSAAPPSIAEEIRPAMSPLQAIGTALATGLLPESLAGIGAQMRRPAGESEEAAYQRGMKELGAKETQAKEALGGLGYGALQMAGGLPMGMRFPGVSARVAKDAPALAKTLAAGKRVAGSAGLAATESAARQGIDDKELSPSQSSALAAGLTGALEVGFPVAGAVVRGVSRIPIIGQGLTQVARSLAEPAAEAVTQARRGISDYIAPRFPQVAQAIEPTDATKVQRVVGRQLPTQGQTVEALQQRAQTAGATTAALGEALTAAEQRVKESAARTAAKGKALESRAEQQAATTMQQLKAEAEQLVDPLRSPQERADALRQVTRSRQTTVGEMNYANLPSFEPGEVYPKGLYQRIESNNTLLSAFNSAVEGKRERILSERLGAEGADVLTGVKGVQLPKYKTGRTFADPTTGNLVEETKDVIDLEIINRMRQSVTDGMESRLSNSSTGISRSEGRKLLGQIDALENDFLKTVPQNQRAALEKARSEYAQEFINLRALQDGLNLFRFGVGGKAELLGAGKTDLRELLADVSQMSPVAKQHFRVGALEAIADMAASTPDDAVKVIQQLVGTPEARKRVGAVFSNQDIQQLSQYLPGQMQRTAETFAGPTRRAASLLQERAATGGGLRTKMLQSQHAQAEAAQLAESLAERQAKTVAETAKKGISALGDITAGRGFAATFPQGLTAAGRQDVAGAMSGAIQDQIRGLRPEEAIRKLQELQGNAAARLMFGSSIDAALTQLQQQQSIFRPIRSAIIGQASGRM